MFNYQANEDYANTAETLTTSFMAVLKQSALQHKWKTITFRSLKNVDTDQLNGDLANAPWTVGETFDAIEDQYDAWKTIF